MAGLRDYSKYATIGLSWVMMTAVYLYLGYRGGMWLDARWDTAPIFFVVGLLSGMVLSVMSLVKELLALTEAGVLRRPGGAGNKNDQVREKNNFPKRADDAERVRRGEDNGETGRNGPSR